MTDLALHRMTDGDIALDGERESQPDAGVAGGVGQRAAERLLVVLIGRRTADRRVVLERHRQREDQVQDVVDGQRRQVAVGRRLHRAARQHRHVDEVTADPEQYHGRYEHLLDDQPRPVQLAAEIIDVCIRRRRVDSSNADFRRRHRR